MEKLTSLLILLFILTLSHTNLNAQDNWDTKTYQIDDFKDIYLEGGFKVYLKHGNENKLVVKASDNDVFDYLQVKNIGNELKIDVEPDSFEFDRIILYITFKELEELKIEGGVKLETKGYLDLDDFYMYVAGGANIELNLKADDVEIIGEGGVLFELEGIAKSLDIKLSGAGHVDADELKSRDVTFKIEGVGTGNVYATETLYAKIEGVGKVRYNGNPTVTKSIEGLGSVKRN